MRVILGERHGAPEVLRVAEREAPRPGSGEVVVDVTAVGVNYLTRPKMADYTASPEELRWRADEVFDWIVKGELEVRIGDTYPLVEAVQAQADLASRRTTGKLLLLLPGL